MWTQQLIAFCALTRMQIRRLFKLWIQTLLPPVLTTFLYFVIFGRVIGTRIGDIHGMSYSSYIAPGLIMLAVINSSYGHLSFTMFLLKFNCSIEEILVSPAANGIILASILCGGILR